MRIRAPYWGAVSVLVCLLATASLVSAATISVPAGGDLQKAIDPPSPGTSSPWRRVPSTPATSCCVTKER